jgi:hypothetical protein
VNNAESRWEYQGEGRNRVLVEWRKLQVDPKYEINKDGVLRRIDTKRIPKDQSKFRYFDGGVRRSISVRKLRNMAWSEDDSSPKLRFRTEAKK